MTERRQRGVDRYALGPAPGQRPLLDEPPCDCPTDPAQRFIAVATAAAFSVMENDGLCAKATATCLVLAAGALMNPANVTDDARPLCRERAVEFADLMEGIARRIRERGTN